MLGKKKQEKKTRQNDELDSQWYRRGKKEDDDEVYKRNFTGRSSTAQPGWGRVGVRVERGWGGI